MAETLAPYFAPEMAAQPCPPPREGGMCGCDEPDEPPKVCLSSECDC
jgi:hypothetical protein